MEEAGVLDEMCDVRNVRGLGRMLMGGDGGRMEVMEERFGEMPRLFGWRFRKARKQAGADEEGRRADGAQGRPRCGVLE